MTNGAPPPEAAATRRRPGRPRGGEAVVTRDEVLAAAIRAIREQGPDVTMDDIATAAGVTKPVLYRTVGDKEAFVGALSEVMVDTMRVASDRAIAELGDDPGPDAPGDVGRAVFRSALHGCLVAIDRDRNLFAFVNAGGPGTTSFGALVDRSSIELIEQLTMLRAQAGLDPGPARTWAYALVGAIQVVAMMWLRDDFRPVDDLASDLADLMWPGVSTTG